VVEEERFGSALIGGCWSREAGLVNKKGGSLCNWLEVCIWLFWMVLNWN
jgi:hypothetical protein